MFRCALDGMPLVSLQHGPNLLAIGCPTVRGDLLDRLGCGLHWWLSIGAGAGPTVLTLTGARPWSTSPNTSQQSPSP